ncbi:MAG: universal stress protein [Chloroflexi bacterium]|nr:universal stress protein [Chloroflexota bacterium]
MAEGRENNSHDRVADGDPGELVIATGGGLPNPMIVMTTRGASGLRRHLRVSVADQVVRGAHIPTMVVPPVATLTGRCMD